MKKMFKKCFTVGLAVIFMIFIAGIFTTCDVELPNLGSETTQSEEQPGKVVETYDGLLGSGYNIIHGRFYNSEDLKSVVLDTNKMATDGLIIVDSRNQRLTRTDYIAGESLRSYMDSAALNVNASAGVRIFSFRASVSADFGISTSSKAESSDSFGKTTTTLIKQRDSIRPYSISDIQNKYLLDTFKDSWLMNTSVSPKELMQSYGTHILLFVDLGGRLDMSYVIQNKYEEGIRQTESQIRAKLQTRFTSVSTGVTTGQTTENSFKESEINETIKSFGGSVGIDLTTFQNARENYERWAQSIENSDNLTLINAGRIGDRMQMLPIWELIDPTWPGGADRIAAIKAEFDEQLELFDSDIIKMQEDYARPLPPGVWYVKDVYTARHSGTPDQTAAALSAKTTEPMLVVRRDLNYGSGDRVYMGYTFTTNPEEATTNILARVGSNPPETIDVGDIEYRCESHQVNINHGASAANAIHLYHTKDSRAGSPIKLRMVEARGGSAGNGDLSPTGQDPFGKDWPTVLNTLGGSTGWSRVNRNTTPTGTGFDFNTGSSNTVEVYIWMQR